MKKRIRDMLTKNWKWKILALMAAVLFWYAYVNIEDPVVTETIDDVKVEVMNYQDFIDKGNNLEFKDTTLNIENLMLDVTVKARTSVIQKLREKKDLIFDIWIDLYEMEKDDDRLVVHYEIDPAYQYTYSSVIFVNYSNKSYYEVAIEVDEMVTVPLRYSIIGSPAEGYTYIEDDPGIVATPNEISLLGPESEIENVAYGMIKVSVEGAKSNVAPSEPITFYDKDGNRLYFTEGAVTPSVNAASLYIPIYQVKKLTIQPSFTGEPAEGYVYTSNAVLSADSVMVYGQEADLENVRTLMLPAIDLGQYKGSASEHFSIPDLLQSLYPNSTIQYYSGVKNVQVNFSVDELVEKTIEIPTKQFTITGIAGRTCKFVEKTVKVNVQGTQAQLDALEISEISGTVSVSGYKAGVHTLKVKLLGITDVTILDDEVKVRIDIEE